VTLNTPQGKGKQVVDHGEGTSSCFKKKKNGKRHRDDNFVAAVECKASCPKGNPGQACTNQGPLREAPGCTVPTPRGPRQAHVQGVPANEELRQEHPQAEDGGSARQARSLPQQR
jgi:hypothetical protein